MKKACFRVILGLVAGLATSGFGSDRAETLQRFRENQFGTTDARPAYRQE